MKRITYILFFAVALVISCCNKKDENKRGNNQATKKSSTKTQNRELSMKKIDTPEFDIVTTHGTMRVRLYDKTPEHRDNFVKHVSDKYYDGIRFHRVIEGFMIQTGDPLSRDTSLINKWGTGGPDYTVPAEFVSNYHHKKGALAAARKGDLANPRKASSGSQFYIVHDSLACSHLDGQYTIFGEVISGLEVIDAIATVATDRYDRPYEDVIITAIKPVIEIASAPAAKSAEESAEESLEKSEEKPSGDASPAEIPQTKASPNKVKDRKELQTKVSPANGIQKAYKQSNEEFTKNI